VPRSDLQSQDIIKRLEDIAKVEASPNKQGKRISCTLAPK